MALALTLALALALVFILLAAKKCIISLGGGDFLLRARASMIRFQKKHLEVTPKCSQRFRAARQHNLIGHFF